MAKLRCPKFFELTPLWISDCSVSINLRALLALPLPSLTIDFCIGRPFWRLSCGVRPGMRLVRPAMLRAGSATGSFSTSIRIFSLLLASRCFTLEPTAAFYVRAVHDGRFYLSRLLNSSFVALVEAPSSPRIELACATTRRHSLKFIHAHALYACDVACTNLIYAFRLQMNKLAYARLLCYTSFRSVIMPHRK